MGGRVGGAQVRRLLSSEEAVAVAVGGAAEAGEPEAAARQHRRLLALAVRTLARPLGRAALDLGAPPSPHRCALRCVVLEGDSLLKCVGGQCPKVAVLLAIRQRKGSNQPHPTRIVSTCLRVALVHQRERWEMGGGEGAGRGCGQAPGRCCPRRR